MGARSVRATVSCASARRFEGSFRVVSYMLFYRRSNNGSGLSVTSASYRRIK